MDSTYDIKIITKRCGFVLANGSLATSLKQEYNIRKGMLEDDIVDCIITLPDKLFSTTGIPVSLWFLRKQKTRNNEVLFIDMRERGELVDRKIRELSKNDILEASQTYHNWLNKKNYEDIKGYCCSVNIEIIKENDYSLVSGRYVGIEKSNSLTDEEINEKIKKVSAELEELFKKDEEYKNIIKNIIIG